MNANVDMIVASLGDLSEGEALKAIEEVTTQLYDQETLDPGASEWVPLLWEAAISRDDLAGSQLLLELAVLTSGAGTVAERSAHEAGRPYALTHLDEASGWPPEASAAVGGALARCVATAHLALAYPDYGRHLCALLGSWRDSAPIGSVGRMVLAMCEYALSPSSSPALEELRDLSAGSVPLRLHLGYVSGAAAAPADTVDRRVQ